MSTGFDNGMAWQHQPGHYEVWYLTLTHRASRTGFWIRYTLRSPSAPALGRGGAGDTPPYAQVWFAQGDSQDSSRTFGINHRFPIEALTTTERPFNLQIGENRLWRAGLSGGLRGNGRDVSWDLRFLPVTRTHFHLPTPLYVKGGSLVPTVVFSPNLSIPVRGTITVDGKRYEFDGDPAGQTHLWGRKHAYAWAWGHCNAYDIEGGSRLPKATPAVLETLSVRMRRGPVVVPLTLFTVYPDGLDGEALRFTDWAALPFTRSDYRTGHYSLSGENLFHRVEALFSCQPDDMVRTEYIDPDGAPAYCHFAAAASCRLTLFKRLYPGAKWQQTRQLATEHGAQFEWGGRAGDSLVKKRNQRIDGG